MQKFKSFSLFLLAASLLALSGCRNLKYQPKHLQPISKGSSKTSATHNNVTICAKKLNQEECNYYFSSNRLKSKPIQLSIDNQSNTDWIIATKNINLELQNSEFVKRKLQSSIGKSVVLGIFLPVVGIIHGVFSHKANKRIARDIDEKSLIVDTIIDQGDKQDMLIFVHKNSNTRNFAITLVDAHDKNNRITFNLSA